MTVSVVRVDGGGYRLDGDGPITEIANRWLAHLEVRCFSPGTVRGYTFDVLNFSRFLVERNIAAGDVVPTDLFDWLAWQSKPAPTKGKRVVRLSAQAGASPATMNRRVAAVRGRWRSVRSWRGGIRTGRETPRTEPARPTGGRTASGLPHYWDP